MAIRQAKPSLGVQGAKGDLSRIPPLKGPTDIPMAAPIGSLGASRTLGGGPSKIGQAGPATGVQGATGGLGQASNPLRGGGPSNIAQALGNLTPKPGAMLQKSTQVDRLANMENRNALGGPAAATAAPGPAPAPGTVGTTLPGGLQSSALTFGRPSTGIFAPGAAPAGEAPVGGTQAGAPQPSVPMAGSREFPRLSQWQEMQSRPFGTNTVSMQAPSSAAREYRRQAGLYNTAMRHLRRAARRGDTKAAMDAIGLSEHAAQRGFSTGGIASHAQTGGDIAAYEDRLARGAQQFEQGQPQYNPNAGLSGNPQLDAAMQEVEERRRRERDKYGGELIQLEAQPRAPGYDHELGRNSLYSGDETVNRRPIGLRFR